MTFDYDLFVIGGGSGGVRAARVASGDYGAKVGLAEESRMGGTCVIRGCVPKKLMVYASAFPGVFEEARGYGWEVTGARFDWLAFRKTLEAELDRLEGAYRNTLKTAGVTVHDARAVVVDAHRVRLADGQEFTAKHILIATGGRPFVPDIPGAELAVTSNEMFHLDALPEAGAGGGRRLYRQRICLHPERVGGQGQPILSRARRSCGGSMTRREAMWPMRCGPGGVDIHCGTDVMRLEKTAGGIRAVATDGTEREFDLVLYATGRRPNVAGLGLEGLGVGFAREGQIVVDKFSQTAVPSIFAVGDVTGRINLTPVAIREGHAFADTVFGGKPTVFDHELVASAVFTQPEMGSVGLSEEAAREREPIEVYSTAFRPMKTLFAGKQDRVLMKLIVSQATRKVLGCHIVAPDAGEMIQLAAIAIGMGATKEDFDRTCAVHPTMAEELVTMRKPVRKG
jgi:glutathione reductase (NADPH)